MNNDQFVERAGGIQADVPENQQQQPVPEIQFLVFYIDNSVFAFYAEQVREILMDTPLFFIPFAPLYVRGFINRHGEPYTVIDTNVFFGKPAIDSVTYLIMNKKDDQVAFIISSVLEIMKVPVNKVHPPAGPQGSVFKGSFTVREQEIFILDPDSIVNRLESDIGGAG